MVIGVIDPHSWNVAAFFAWLARLKGAVAAQRAERHIGDRFVGAGDENVENGQYAVKILLLQIDFHVFGDEIGRAERGLHCVFQVAERAGKIRDPQRIGRRPHRFLPAEDVDRSPRKELIDIKEIGTAKHIERDRNGPRRLREISVFPRVQFLELAQIEF